MVLNTLTHECISYYTDTLFYIFFYNVGGQKHSYYEQ